MKYLLKKEVKAILNIKIEAGVLIMTDKNYCVILENNEKLQTVFDVFIIDDKWIVNCLDNSLGVLNENNETQLLFPNAPISHIDRLHKTALLSFDSSDYGYQRVLLDLITLRQMNKSIWARIEQSFLCNKTIYSSINGNSVYGLNIEKNEHKWNFTLESLHQEYDLFSEKWNKPMEIANFCGVANEVLWIDVVCRGIGNFLLGLDVHTGQPVHLLDKAENRFERYPFDMIPTDGRTTYDAKRNILFGFAPDWVHWQVDLSDESPKIKMWDLTEEVTPRNAYVSAYMNCGISDSHIFFPVGSLGSTPQVFALNRETLKIDWQYHFTEGGQYFTPTKVEVTDTHLYVLDNTGTLHIFEKTEDN